MRIGIVGGGGAGLAAAWLLERDHEVTLFERDERLGGHARTVDVPAGGQGDSTPLPVDLGAEFLSPWLHPVTLRLMRLAGVALRPFPLTVTLWRPGGAPGLVLPPFQRGRVGWGAFRPRTLRHLLQLRRLLRSAPAAPDPGTAPFTLDEVLDHIGATRAFREELFYPLTLSGWCVEMEEFRAFCAHNVLSYLAPGGSFGATPGVWLDPVGGMGAYVRAVAAMLGRAEVRLSAPVAAIRPRSRGYRVVAAGAADQDVDAVILATGAVQARAVLGDLPSGRPLRAVLGGVRYGTTRIAVHGDPRLMPPRRREWSVVNTRFDGAHSQNTMWKPWRQPEGGHAFKSWVTYDSGLPEPLFHLATFEHAKVDRAYFEAQRALEPLQGRDGLWLAGVYTTGIDSHESAIRSAMAIAGRLAPASARLRALAGPAGAESVGSGGRDRGDDARHFGRAVRPGGRRG